MRRSVVVVLKADANTYRNSRTISRVGVKRRSETRLRGSRLAEGAADDQSVGGRENQGAGWKSSWLSSFGAELDGCPGRCRIRRRWICRVTKLEWTRGFVGKLPWRDGTVCWNLGRRELWKTWWPKKRTKHQCIPFRRLAAARSCKMMRDSPDRIVLIAPAGPPRPDILCDGAAGAGAEDRRIAGQTSEEAPYSTPPAPAGILTAPG
eukprot:gene9768-biopygen3247